MQKVDYRYNIRGWLTDINNVRDLTILSEPEDLFAFQISYDRASPHVAPVEPLYNGNISETFWRTSSDNLPRKYGYVYDDLNRLKDAYYQKDENPVVVTNSYNEHLNYDKNGNITSLNRNGNLDDQSMFIQIDELDYDYFPDSNILKEVRDDSEDPMGFRDSSTTGTDYGYDANGNMISDANKEIGLITYNHLNLPVTIDFGTIGTITYLYDATGRKVKKQVVDVNLSSQDKTDYMNGFQYKNHILQFFPTAEGYVNTTYCENCQLSDQYKISYVYNYTDHLGNIRVSYAIDPDTSELKILEENHYYPFGLKHTNYNGTLKTFKEEEQLLKIKNVPSFFTTAYQYKYNGKEWQEELNLNLYDYRARNYDPAIGRWMNIDPLAEVYRRWTPYNYVMNNPLIFTDPDGMGASPIYGTNGQFLGTDSEGFTGEVLFMSELTFALWGGQGMGHDVATTVGQNLDQVIGDNPSETFTQSELNMVNNALKDVAMRTEGYQTNGSDLHNLSTSAYFYQQGNKNADPPIPTVYKVINDPNVRGDWAMANTDEDINGKAVITYNLKDFTGKEFTVNNIQNAWVHEYGKHYKGGVPGDENPAEHATAIEAQSKHSTWNGTTKEFKIRMRMIYTGYTGNNLGR